jgi:RHS repeat-associated protein
MRMATVTRIRAALLSLAFALGLSSPVFAQGGEEVIYYHTDAIGSVRATTNAAGQITHYDYLPFGESWQPPAAPETRRFGGKERDAETGFDYFGARYYASGNGRFTTVDPAVPLSAALQDPQLWNRYTYVRNSPLRYTDPDGRCIWDLCIGEVAVALGVTEVAVAAGYASVVTTVWLASPPGRQAVSNVVNQTGTIITAAVDAIGSSFQAAKAKSSEQIRKEYEAKTGQPWPKDEKTGRNQDVSHETPKADGGTDDLSNIKPRPRDEHVDIHKQRGDFKRWGARRTPKPDEEQQ